MPEISQTTQSSSSGIKYFTLLEVARSIEKTIHERFTGRYWVKAEIAKLNFYPKSGHCYPDLVEKMDGKLLAQMRSTIWASYYDAINRKFKEATKEELREGMTLLLLVKVEFHATHGMQLNILDVDTDYSLGQMAREKKETMAQLKKEGIFDSNRNILFPLLPKKIAIISVQTSKGYHDLMSVLDKNEWGYRFSHLLFPALLQGDHAVQSIRTQLWQIKKYAEHFDVVLIIRGGGGDIGLSCYDNYELAKDVALLPIPVITGIGHSTNETVVEMVANQNKITPTDVAYFLIQQFHNFAVKVQEMQDIIVAYAENVLSAENQRMHEQIRHFKSNTTRLIDKNKFLLQSSAHSISKNTRSFISTHRRSLWESVYRLNFKPVQMISDERSALANCSKLIAVHIKQVMKNESMSLATFETKVKLLEPRNVLKRGYSITFHNGRIVKDVDVLKAGELIKTEVYNGKIESKVESIGKPDGR